MPIGKTGKFKINFNSTYEYEQLCKEFEYVILAPGDGDYAVKLGNYRCDLTCSIKGSQLRRVLYKYPPCVV